METTLFLTPAEQKRFDAFEDALKEGWQVEDETIDAMESQEVLRMRSRMADFDQYPEVKKLMEKVEQGETPDALRLDDIPENILHELAFTLGAVGLTSLMEALFDAVSSDEDIQGLAGFSHLRHEILAVNSSISYV